MKIEKKAPPIRIAHVLGKMHGGGVEAMVMNYYRHIDRSRIQFDFIVDEDSSIVPYDEITALGGRVFIVPAYQQVIQYRQALMTILKENHYGIIHSHINALSVFPLSTAKRAGVPIRIAHSHSTAAPGETVKNIIKNILRPLSKTYPTHFCSCSRGSGEWLFGKKFVTTDRLTIINNGIEVEKFMFDEKERAKIRRELGITDKYVIGHTGRLSFQKNQEFLISLIHELSKKEPDVVLLLLGNGQEREKLIRQAQRLDIRDKIHFLGNKSDVNRYYNAMDIFAFPSRYEGFGISAIEAQVSGMPVILSDNVPQEACLTGKCKFLSIDQGVKPWVETVTQYKRDPGRESNIDIFDYNIEHTAEKLEAYYFEIIHESVRA
ncbi:Glycosyltransferase involved in cell wall bisynthesis [Alkalibacterium subtropicum]|uniref:Glycosyltransferase involved in cell wall bisynthesis n=1 Tax=Alkalibacterium subtropicum TaxID=753702 RepID=A0A1I1GDP7_9LACT|nr:glycosyltransferase family 1 protein [Alkalibacterium subtropicum]SFC09859.1 Glycosyltransferase involved in cell wall bisynthesis [Alkalibacterium subtropicum]